MIQFGILSQETALKSFEISKNIQSIFNDYKKEQTEQLQNNIKEEKDREEKAALKKKLSSYESFFNNVTKGIKQSVESALKAFNKEFLDIPNYITKETGVGNCQVHYYIANRLF